MLCEKCNKNEATIHYTEVINGVRKERNLCSECMQELDYNMDGEFPFSKLLKGILTAHLGNVSFDNNPAMQIKCNKCGMDYELSSHHHCPCGNGSDAGSAASAGDPAADAGL